MRYAHPIYTGASVGAQKRLSELNGEALAFAGAYHGWGFHEDGCRSGIAAANFAGGPLVMEPAPTTSNAVPSSSLSPSPLPVLYASVVTHTRQVPIKNRFRYKASYWLVDYDQLPELTGLIRHLARFERSDHSEDAPASTEQGVTANRILMLAMPRTLGYVFNPLQRVLVLRRSWGASRRFS